MPEDFVLIPSPFCRLSRVYANPICIIPSRPVYLCRTDAFVNLPVKALTFLGTVRNLVAARALPQGFAPPSSFSTLPAPRWCIQRLCRNCFSRRKQRRERRSVEQRVHQAPGGVYLLHGLLERGREVSIPLPQLHRIGPEPPGLLYSHSAVWV